MALSIFTRPRRQIQGAVAAAVAVQEVDSESRLRVAIGAAAKFAPFGGATIRIIKPFSVTAPVIIPAELAFGRIEGAAPISAAAGVTLARLFDIRAAAFTFDGIQARPGDGVITAFVGNTGTDDLDLLTIRGCLVQATSLFVDAATGSPGSHAFISNTLIGTGGTGITVRGVNCVIQGNRGLAGIVVADGSTFTASECSIGGNTDAGTITTTASTGNNAVYGNTGSTLALHASDQQAANT